MIAVIAKTGKTFSYGSPQEDRPSVIATINNKNTHRGEPVSVFYYAGKSLNDLLAVPNHNTLILRIHFLASQIVGR